MEIRLNNKYVISSDPYGYSLARVKNRAVDGSEYLQNFAYFGDLKSAFARVLEQDLRDSEATEIRQLLEQLAEAEAMCLDALLGHPFESPAPPEEEDTPEVTYDFG